MSSKSRFPPKPKKGKQGQKSSPESADDFQAAADAEEETGGKWRVGDKAKSCRAFLRAIEIYDRGLGRHPRNFDLAYNKARLEFEVSQQTNLVAKLPIPLQDFLQQALKSHKYALSLNEENTDILFNTAQILITLAELVEDESDSSTFNPAEPASWLREALELLDACFSRQQMIYEEQAQAWNERDDGDPDGGVSLSSDPRPATPSSTSTGRTEQSATVQSAITPEDLLDTCLASLSALTQLLSLTPTSSQPLASLATQLLTTKIPPCISLLDPSLQAEYQSESSLAHATFTAALAEAEYTTRSIPAETYLQRLTLFSTLDQSSTEVKCDWADALISYATSTLPTSLSDPVSHEVLTQALTLYHSAISQLTTPQKGSRKDADGAMSLSLSLVPKMDAEQEQRLGALHEAVGDADLMLFRVLGAMGEEATQVPGVVDVRGEAVRRVQLAREAYAAAEGAYTRSGDENGARKVGVRGVVSSLVMSGRNEGAAVGIGKLVEAGRRVVRNMVDEQVLGGEWLELIGG
ncbi:hypothetical protein C1H76_0284 [Elsinoe australis]|uniref:Uncharacterized protein n=1 Tax=Elsinoe australis TaxID=40998 RepID=A0A4U7BGT2_9PEZI|nr:hypothetical protein C1H76_0284 [Elsinoe australis]